MKKFIAGLLSSVMITSASASVSAAVGDVSGHIYTTDIAAFIDGMPIESYNIGGKTAVVAENLQKYGFYVEWQSENRFLILKTEPIPQNIPSYTLIPQKPGNIAGNIYETDIRVFLNGCEIPSFNLNGSTAITIEDMVDLLMDRYSYAGNPLAGMDKPYRETAMYYDWNGENRTISLNCIRPQGMIQTNFGDYRLNCNRLEADTYECGGKTFYGMDGEIYGSWVDYIELNDNVYVPLKDIMDTLGGTVVCENNTISITAPLNLENRLRDVRAGTSKSSSNIMYPIDVKVNVNGEEIVPDKPVCYAYKGTVYISLDVFNKNDEYMIREAYDLPKDCGESIGKIVPTKHIVYINDYAIDAYLSNNGELYIPVDNLKEVEFGISTTYNSRDITTPYKSPDFSLRNVNVPGSIYIEDYENKGYLFEYYKGLHSVTIDKKPVSSVYIHFLRTFFTPCVPLDEFVKTAGYSMEKIENETRIYTRADKKTVEKTDSKLYVKADGKVIKEFPSTDYFDIRIIGDYVMVSIIDSDSELYSIDSFEKLLTLNGYVSNIKEGKIYSYENTYDDNGEWSRKYYVYDMQCNQLDTYITGEDN